MFERFTRQARNVVEGALRVAEDEDAEELLPGHLLGALLVEGNRAQQVLAGLGATPDRVRAELEQRRSRYAAGLGDEAAEALATIGIDLEEVLRRVEPDDRAVGRRRKRRRFSQASKKALELSLREAIDLGHHHIGAEHILLGIVRGGDPLVLDTLAAVDVTPERLRVAVSDAVRRAG